jgi:anti-anti-sigma factor
VKRIPERLNLKQARAFCREMEPILNSDRPQLVFDCSQVKQIDAGGVEMLLQCLVQVMQRDGDVKLAALSAEMAVVLEMTRTDRLFEIYDSSSDAVLSFSRFLPAALRDPVKFWMPTTLPAPVEPAEPQAETAAAAGDLAA